MGKVNFWKEWDNKLDRFAEWLVVGSIASMSLEPLPGIASLIFIVFFFTIRRANQPNTELQRYNTLRNQKRGNLGIEDKLELNQLESREEKSPRNAKAYVLGFCFWLGSLIYLLFGKGGANEFITLLKNICS